MDTKKLTLKSLEARIIELTGQVESLKKDVVDVLTTAGNRTHVGRVVQEGGKHVLVREFKRQDGTTAVYKNDMYDCKIHGLQRPRQQATGNRCPECHKDEVKAKYGVSAAA